MWKPESRCKTVASHGPFLPSLDASTSPRGQALNPIQVGFLIIERHPSAIPFDSEQKSNRVARREVLTAPQINNYLSDNKSFMVAAGSSR